MPAVMFRPVPVEQEPKRKNRFVLEFPTELGIESYLVQTSGKPKITIGNTEIPYMNTSTWVAGRYKWEPIDIEFIDVIGPSTTQKVIEWVRLHAESATGKMGYAVGYKKNLVLKALDPVGIEVEKWTLIGCFITSAEFDSYDYSAEDLIKVKINVQPDRCLLAT
jgi:hypothetical protein